MRSSVLPIGKGMQISHKRRGLMLGAISAAAGFSLLAVNRAAKAADTTTPLATRLAEYVAGLGYADIDAGTLEALKLRLVDTFGCAIASLDEPLIAKCYHLAGTTAEGKATLIGTRRRTTAEQAAFANGAAIRYYDLNDGYASKEIGHPSDFVSVCLAVAQAEGKSIRDFIVSVVAAYEIECRLFDAAAISTRGWDNPTYGVVTAALAAGKLMDLSVEQLAQAVNIALVDHVAMNQTRVQVLSNWKGLADASASRNGVFAAILAREGVSGPSPIFEGNLGFNKLVAGANVDVDTAAFGGKGKPFRINNVLVKPFAAQGHTLTAFDASVRLARKIRDKSQIDSVSVATTKVGYGITSASAEVWKPETKETADHSMPYIVARALLDGTITSDSYDPQKLRALDVQAFMAKIRIAEDPTLTALYPRHIPNRVSVTLRSGEVLTEQVNDLPGAPEYPVTRAFIEEKFWRTVGTKFTRKQGDALMATIWSLEHAGSVDALLDATVLVR